MVKRRALILLGGMWHDFDGFARCMLPLLEGAGWQAQSSYDLDHLTRLETGDFDLVLHYTCFSKHAAGLDNAGPEKLTDAQIAGLTGWVQAGGGFLSAHAASVCGTSGPGLAQLTGGFFVEHPPEFNFTVYPVNHPHPITAGVGAFTVYDELYIEEYDPSVAIQMLTVDRGVAYPLVWSKAEGLGRVAHVAIGHSALVWELKAYQRLMLQTADWLINKNAL